MNLYSIFRLLGAAYLLTGQAGGATLDLRFSPTDGTREDAMYLGISTASTGSTNLPGVVPTLTGRGYGVEQTGKDRWGIAAGPLEWDSQKTGWTVRNGFAPDKVGSTVSTLNKVQGDASYLSIMLTDVAGGTIFKNVALTFTDVTFLRPSKAWAGTTADAFAGATAMTFTAVKGVQRLAVTLPEFTYFGGEPLEIRLYGIIGSDEGAFNVLSVSGEFTAPAPVPEPDAKLLITTVILGAAVSFRRRSNALPR